MKVEKHIDRDFFFFVVVVAIVVFDFQTVVCVYFSSIIYSLFILSPKALETILHCFDFVDGRIMK